MWVKSNITPQIVNCLNFSLFPKLFWTFLISTTNSILLHTQVMIIHDILKVRKTYKLKFKTFLKMPNDQLTEVSTHSSYCVRKVTSDIQITSNAYTFHIKKCNARLRQIPKLHLFCIQNCMNQKQTLLITKTLFLIS